MKEIEETPIVAVSLEDLTDSPPRDIVLSEDQSKFLDAVRDGNDHEVREYVLGKSVDVNCVNLNGETALQVAVNNDRGDIAKFLIEHGADVDSALQQAVVKESIDCVKALLDFVEDPKANSPAILFAAQNDSQEILRLLLEKGYTIREPEFHNKSCKCSDCKSLGKRLRCSIYRLHCYRALSSPVYLCLSYLTGNSTTEQTGIKSSKDPIVRAFLLNRELERLVETEYECKSDYRRLSNRCEEFAVSLLQKCRTMEEIGCVMSVPGIDELEHVEVRGGEEAQKLSVLNFAIANKSEKFVAHYYSQLMLNSVLYHDLGGWEESSFITKVLFVLLLTALLPILALCYFVAPNSRVSRFLKKPLFKFVGHTASFVWFLALLICSSIQDKFYDVLEFSPLDILIMLWIAGMLFQEAKEAYRQGRERYVSQYWNLVTLFMLGLFVASGVLWLAGYFMTVGESNTWAVPIKDAFGKSAKDIAYRLILLSNAFFSIGLVLSFFHASNSFQVSSVLGPLQLSLVSMIRDIIKFLFLFLLLFLAFGFAERKVYSQYVQAREAFVGNATEHEFSQIAGSLRYLFWDLFGLAELEDLKTEENFIITQYTGELLLGLYSIASVVVAINMLIAMMSNSYQRVADDADIQWKFSRTRMWMPYFDEGNVMPPPFNLIPPPHLVFQLCRRLCADPRSCVRVCRGGRDRSTSRLRVDLQKRHEVMKRLIRRYLLTFEKTRRHQAPAPELPAERDEGHQLRELVTRLENVLRKTETERPPDVAKKQTNEGSSAVETQVLRNGPHQQQGSDMML